MKRPSVPSTCLVVLLRDRFGFGGASESDDDESACVLLTVLLLMKRVRKRVCALGGAKGSPPT